MISRRFLLSGSAAAPLTLLTKANYNHVELTALSNEIAFAKALSDYDKALRKWNLDVAYADNTLANAVTIEGPFPDATHRYRAEKQWESMLLASIG